MLAVSLQMLVLDHVFIENLAKVLILLVINCIYLDQVFLCIIVFVLIYISLADFMFAAIIFLGQNAFKAALGHVKGSHLQNLADLIDSADDLH